MWQEDTMVGDALWGRISLPPPAPALSCVWGTELHWSWGVQINWMCVNRIETFDTVVMVAYCDNSCWLLNSGGNHFQLKRNRKGKKQDSDSFHLVQWIPGLRALICSGHHRGDRRRKTEGGIVMASSSSFNFHFHKNYYCWTLFLLWLCLTTMPVNIIIVMIKIMEFISNQEFTFLSVVLYYIYPLIN